jgi:hypothetical protein
VKIADMPILYLCEYRNLNSGTGLVLSLRVYL